MSKTKPTPFQHGYHCGLNGPDTINSHFSIFSTQESTEQWEKGKKAGERAKNKPKRKIQETPENTAADDYLDYLDSQY